MTFFNVNDAAQYGHLLLDAAKQHYIYFCLLSLCLPAIVWVASQTFKAGRRTRRKPINWGPPLAMTSADAKADAIIAETEFETYRQDKANLGNEVMDMLQKDPSMGVIKRGRGAYATQPVVHDLPAGVADALEAELGAHEAELFATPPRASAA